ncbi:LuxR C-terminal-related transcriptional regulator [Pseudidiomarina salilacus]|uniref:LuxR C-terminal-related transcriptional regulator n=1 Tax=Pseudidiomarina salilacus TaxID=3384452 RepID=UPI003984C781
MTEFIVAISSEMVSQGMTALLKEESQLKVVATIVSQQQLRDAVSKHPFATVILGSDLCGENTIEVWRRLRHRYRDVQLLLWAQRFQDVLDFQCNVDKVDGYLLSGARRNEFIEACETVGKGRMFVAASIAQYFAQNPARQRQADLLSRLSKREVQVSQLVARGKKVVDIAAILNISTKTVNTFRYRIFAKLGLSGDVELAHLALQTGLIEIATEGVKNSNDDEEGAV